MNNSIDYTAIAVTWIPYLLSVISVAQVYLAGNKSKHAWPLLIINQLFWIFWIVVSKNYGFIPLNVVLMFMGYRNYTKWKKEAKEKFNPPSVNETSSHPEGDGWKPIDHKDNKAPWGEDCLVVNQSSGIPVIYKLRRHIMPTFFTHYKHYTPFNGKLHKEGK